MKKQNQKQGQEQEQNPVGACNDDHPDSRSREEEEEVRERSVCYPSVRSGVNAGEKDNPRSLI